MLNLSRKIRYSVCKMSHNAKAAHLISLCRYSRFYFFGKNFKFNIKILNGQKISNISYTILAENILKILKFYGK